MACLRYLRCCIAGLAVVAAFGCDDGPTTPSQIGTPGGLNLAGTWAGQIGPPQSNVAFKATWTATQTANTVSGPVAITRPADQVAFSGTMTGTVSGSQLAITYTVPRGNVAESPNCSISGTGTLAASTTLMSGTMSLTYTNCQSLTAQPSVTEEVALAKQ